MGGVFWCWLKIGDRPTRAAPATRASRDSEALPDASGRAPWRCFDHNPREVAAARGTVARRARPRLIWINGHRNRRASFALLAFRPPTPSPGTPAGPRPGAGGLGPSLPCAGCGGAVLARKIAMNYLRTAILLAALTALLVGLGYLFGGRVVGLIALFLVVASDAFVYWNFDLLLLALQVALVADWHIHPHLF